MSDFVVAGTGSRSLQTADKVTCARAVAAVTEAVDQLRDEHGDRLVLMSGMAEGWDHLIAWAALRRGVRLWCAVPNHGYGRYYWGRNSLTGMDRLEEFTRILNAAWRRTFVMEEIHHTSDLRLNGLHANYWRNLFMVEQANEFLAWDPQPDSGTEHCVKAARRAGVPWRDLSKGVQAPTLM